MTNIVQVRAAFNPYSPDDAAGLRCEIVYVTPAMARHLRDTAHFERQRKLDPRNIERLAREMQRGWFVAGTPIYVCILPDGSMRIVNGNHTLEAVAASSITVPLTFIYRPVLSVDEIGTIYSTFDIHKVRTWRNAIQAWGMDEAYPMVGNVTTALSFIMDGFRSGGDTEAAQSRGARIKKLPEYRDAATLLEAAWHKAPSSATKLLKRAPVLAVALETAKHQPRAADEFWGKMAHDDGLRSNDPRKALLRYCSNNTVIGHGNRVLHSKAAAAAWNAWFEDRTLEYCKPQSMQTFRLLGTPHHDGLAKPIERKPMFETGMEATSEGMKPVTKFGGA